MNVILNALKNGDNNPVAGEFVFESSDHIRYANGIDVSGHNYGCNRAVKIEKNIGGGNGYTVTIYNMDGPHPVWQNNVQMAPKQMQVIRHTDQQVILDGFGSDFLGNSFADYGMTMFFDDGGTVLKCVLHMKDRGIDIEYKMKNTVKTDMLRELTDDNLLRFSPMERVAIYSALGNMVNMDGAATSEELFYLRKSRECLKLTESENLAARRTDAKTLFTIIASMTKEKKNAVLMLLNEVIIADKPATEKEHWFLGALSVQCRLI